MKFKEYIEQTKKKKSQKKDDKSIPIMFASIGYTHYHDAELIHDGTTN
jgi:hypothetical protein